MMEVPMKTSETSLHRNDFNVSGELNHKNVRNFSTEVSLGEMKEVLESMKYIDISNRKGQQLFFAK